MSRRKHDNGSELFITVNTATIHARYFDTLSFLLHCECDIYEVQDFAISIYLDVNITFQLNSHNTFFFVGLYRHAQRVY